MAAGQGFKTFTTGEVLTAGDVNGYLMQGINVFATTTARDAAITAPAEGQFAFTKDTNSLWYYDGAAWVASGATGDIEGVTAGVGISGGGTSGTVTVTNSMATAIDAKGDLVPGTGADTFARLAVGANDTVLTADSSTATGLKWATAATSADNYTLINTGGTALTGAATVTVSGISGKNKLMIWIDSASGTVASCVIRLQLNTDSGANYSSVVMYDQAGSIGGAQDISDTKIILGTMGGGANNYVSSIIEIGGTNATGFKPINATTYAPGSTTNQSRTFNGFYKGTSAISSVSVICNGGNLDAGTIWIYGA